jgi:hypothetical protein
VTTIDDLELDTNELEETRDAATPKNKCLIERLRAQRAEARPAPFDIVIPDWGADTGGLTFIARMRRIALDGAAARAAAVLEHSLISGKPSTRELAAACDLLIAGLDELYVREPNAEEAVPLDADQPMKFTERTAELHEGTRGGHRHLRRRRRPAADHQRREVVLRLALRRRGRRRGKSLRAANEVGLAAHAALLGLDTKRLLTSDDQFELDLMQAIIHRALELQDQRDENLSIRIANRIVPPLAKMISQALRSSH